MWYAAVPSRPSGCFDNERKVTGEQDAVLGRHMYDEWSRYWPTADEQSFADFINGVKKYLVTSGGTPSQPGDDHWPRRSTSRRARGPRLYLDGTTLMLGVDRRIGFSNLLPASASMTEANGSSCLSGR